MALLAAQALTTGAADAFDGPRGHHQFVLISTKGAPTWGAGMALRDGDGKVLYTWEYGLGNNWKVGGKQVWWFTAGQRAYIDVYVAAADGAGFSKNEVRKRFTFEDGTADGHCFHVAPFGSVRYTGDTDTGGCSPD